MAVNNDPIQYDWGLKPLHDAILEILMYVHELCNKNDISYCLAYGSVLGAIRHKGFIPWDDDADIYMTLNEYEKFRESLQNEQNKKYYLQELRSIDGMITIAKLRLNGTTFIEELYRDYDMHQGIYIDIFILFNAPKSNIQKKFMNFANQYMIIKELSNRNYIRRKAFIPILTLLRFLPKNFLRKRALKELYKYRNQESAIYYDIDMRKYSKSFWNKNDIFPAKSVNFEGTTLLIPQNYDLYLSRLYGDYMKLPDIETIRHTQHASEWYTDIDFKTILPNIDCFKDEN